MSKRRFCPDHNKQFKFNYQKDRNGNTHLVQRCLICNKGAYFVHMKDASYIENTYGKIPMELSQKAQKVVLPDNKLKLF